MKKLLLLGALAMLPGLVVGAQSAYAIPTLTLTVEATGATAGDCTAIGGSVIGGLCTVTSTTGTLATTPGGNFANFFLTIFGGKGNGTDIHSLTQPSLWLDANASTDGTTFGKTLTLKLTAKDYSVPLGLFALTTLPSGSLDPGLTSTQSAYFDSGNTGVAGAGTQIYSDTWVGPTVSPGAPPVTLVTNAGLYSESWIQVLTRTDSATTVHAAGTQLEIIAAPTPGTLALFGLGLAAVGFMTRRSGMNGKAA